MKKILILAGIGILLLGIISLDQHFHISGLKTHIASLEISLQQTKQENSQKDQAFGRLAQDLLRKPIIFQEDNDDFRKAKYQLDTFAGQTRTDDDLGLRGIILPDPK